MPTYEYPRPALTADAVLLRGAGDDRHVLLIRRAYEPFKDMWALPGGFVDEYELPEDAARRELAEEAGIEHAGPLALAGVFGERGRDPRGWLVTVAFVGIAEEGVRPVAGDDAADAAWYRLDALPPLASDHARIIEAAIRQAELLGW